jgi:hypothetical protein
MSLGPLDLDHSRDLARELILAGVTAGNAEKNEVSARIYWRGGELFHDLLDRFGSSLAPLRQAFVPGLGVGAVLTEFATADVPLSPDCRRALAGLGGLMILNVSVFDRVLDSGRPTPDVCFSAAPQCQPLYSGSTETMLAPLQAEYFRRLDDLPQNQPQLRSMADTVIQRMYAAEIHSVSESPVARSTWWRKNSLPIVMLGLPAWIATDSFSSSAWTHHLMWLARLGEFFGWLDDCIDYMEDVRLGHANRIDARLRFISKEQLVRQIAAQGKRVLAQWSRVNGESPLRSTFAVIVWSWIENKPARMAS